jgi:hypothetical protein
MVAFGLVVARSRVRSTCCSSSSVYSSSFEGVPSHSLSMCRKSNVWYSALSKKDSMNTCISEVWLREEKCVSSHWRVFLYGSHKMMRLGSRVGIVVARAVITAWWIACV